ncbi:MAG TPA: L,D-transpeptidase [Patescibacteria group bacterium]|jgi:lipoprotein-anchoring transpeptidase ErfK/SrfK|nr:L,D-transpeptidase [Patescibacteria group bacterium]
MAKKSSRHKGRTGKNRGWFAHLKRYLPLLFVGAIFFATTTVALRVNQTPPICANSKSCTSDLSEKIENDATGMFQGEKVIPPQITTAMASLSQPPVLGANTTSGEKHIYIDLSTQTLYAYQGTTLVLKTLISSGKWAPTPTGNFHIWEKLLATRMAGGEGAAAYDLPNVPYVMYFYHDFGLHGAYWHDNFGHAMSHGCVNMRSVDAKVLFDWTDGPSGNTLGTAVSVCDQITDAKQCVQNNPVQ